MANRFEHYIVLMLENRSFDHIFGYLDLDGCEKLPARGAVNYQKPGIRTSPAFKSQQGGDFTAIGEGPSHSLKQTNEQLFGVSKPTAAAQAAVPPLDGFVASFAVSLQYDLKRAPTTSELQQVMNVFDPLQLPVLSALAKNFVLCDHWFADLPGPTMPNRAFVHAATSQGYTDNASWKPHFTCKTLYDRINDVKDYSWRIYYHDQNDVAELYPDLPSEPQNQQFFSTFVGDVTSDGLATYSFIVPAFFGTPEQPINSMHAPADVRPAEKLVADVYGALQQNPDVWKKTLLIVVFDEHGGYYDHVPPPACVAPDNIPGRTDESWLVAFDFKRLGLRVPAILVSPWFKAGVDKTVYSHSTIPGSIIEVLDLPGGFLTERDKNAAKLTQRYLTAADNQVWRTDVPVLVPPAQPQAIDSMQREMLQGAAHMDPDPNQRTDWRVQDIQNPAQAKQFAQVQVAKRLEHNLAKRKRHGHPAPTASAYNQLPGGTLSPSRIAELNEPAPAVPDRRP